MAAQDQIEVKADVVQFSKDLDVYLTTVNQEEIPDFVRALAFEFLKNVALLTPVDTGRARAGWYAAMGGGGGEGERVEITGKDSFTIEITNRVHYIVYLEYGHSKQAPQGFVRVTINKMAQKIKGRK